MHQLCCFPQFLGFLEQKRMCRCITKPNKILCPKHDKFLTFLDMFKKNEEVVQKLSRSQLQRINTLNQTQMNNVLGTIKQNMVKIYRLKWVSNSGYPNTGPIQFLNGAE